MAIPFNKISRTFLQQEPPRQIPLRLVLKLTLLHLREKRTISLFASPIAGGAFVASGLVAFQSKRFLRKTVFLATSTILSALMWRASKRLFHDLHLLKHGHLVNAQVLAVRPCTTEQGAHYGTFVDLWIPIGERRCSAGSFWIPDHVDSARLKDRTHILVICLPHVPGTWYLIEPTVPDAVPHSRSTSQLNVQPELDHQ